MSPVLPLSVAALLACAGLVWTLSRRVPRSDRDWAADHATPARVTFGEGCVHIARLRDFRHAPGGRFQPGYRDETIQLADVQRLWLVLAPFAKGWRGPAHVFVSFELAGGRFISVSVEARRESHETYSVVAGLFGKFEVTYVVGLESDLLGLRAVRGDPLLLYPCRTTPEQARALFLEVLRGAEAHRTRPRLYNSLTRNCATLFAAHVNRVLPEPLPFSWSVLLPGYADGLALARGLLDTELPLGRARAHFRVERRARSALLHERLSGSAFSLRIRQGSESGAAVAATPAPPDPGPPLAGLEGV